MATIFSDGMVKTSVPEELAQRLAVSLAPAYGGPEHIPNEDLEFLLTWAEESIARTIALIGMLKGEFLAKVEDGELMLANTREVFGELIDTLLQGLGDEDLETLDEFIEELKPEE